MDVRRFKPVANSEGSVSTEFIYGLFATWIPEVSFDPLRLVPEIETILADADKSLISDMADRSRACQSGNGGERLCSVSSALIRAELMDRREGMGSA